MNGLFSGRAEKRQNYQNQPLFDGRKFPIKTWVNACSSGSQTSSRVKWRRSDALWFGLLGAEAFPTLFLVLIWLRFGTFSIEHTHIFPRCRKAESGVIEKRKRHHFFGRQRELLWEPGKVRGKFSIFTAFRKIGYCFFRTLPPKASAVYAMRFIPPFSCIRPTSGHTKTTQLSSVHLPY